MCVNNVISENVLVGLHLHDSKVPDVQLSNILIKRMLINR